MSAAGNIFIGQTEAPLLVRPFMKDMTSSELHAVMTGGFATIAGSVFGIYASFGIDPVALLASSAMSAPAALAISKLGKFTAIFVLFLFISRKQAMLALLGFTHLFFMIT